MRVGRRIWLFLVLWVCALTAEAYEAREVVNDIADLIENSTFYRNYRWVVTESSLRPFRGDARFQELVRRLHSDWQPDLSALRDGLRRPPPTLPTPDQYFTR